MNLSGDVSVPQTKIYRVWTNSEKGLHCWYSLRDARSLTIRLPFSEILKGSKKVMYAEHWRLLLLGLDSVDLRESKSLKEVNSKLRTSISNIKLFISERAFFPCSIIWQNPCSPVLGYPDRHFISLSKGKETMQQSREHTSNYDDSLWRRPPVAPCTNWFDEIIWGKPLLADHSVPIADSWLEWEIEWSSFINQSSEWYVVLFN